MSLFFLALGFLAGRISCSALTNVSGRAQGRRGVHNNSGEQLLDKTRVTKYRDKPVHHKSEWVVDRGHSWLLHRQWEAVAVATIAFSYSLRKYKTILLNTCVS